MWPPGKRFTYFCVAFCYRFFYEDESLFCIFFVVLYLYLYLLYILIDIQCICNVYVYIFGSISIIISATFCKIYNVSVICISLWFCIYLFTIYVSMWCCISICISSTFCNIYIYIYRGSVSESVSFFTFCIKNVSLWFCISICIFVILHLYLYLCGSVSLSVSLWFCISICISSTFCKIHHL